MRCAARYAMWNGVPAPPSVTSSRCSTGMVVAGTNASTKINRHPVMRPACNQLVVEAPPRRRHDQQCAPSLLGDETNFSFAVDGQHWVLYDAEPRQRAYEDERLEPCRQQPRDVRFGADPQGLEPRSDAQC